MSLNKFTDLTYKPWMKINCSEFISNNVTIKANDGALLNMTPPTVGSVNQVLSSNGNGSVSWQNGGGGGGGITNPLTATIYPANPNVDLGAPLAPFRKLYVQHQTIELVNSVDSTKSGSISINDGNINLTTNHSIGNVNLGYNAGVGANENSTNIGNETGLNCGSNCVNLGVQAGYQNCLANAINIGNGAGISKSGLNSISIGTLAGSSVLGGINGTSSICIGQSAGQGDVGDNSIIINGTGLPLDTLETGALIVKPIREINNLNSNILAYNTTTGEITSNSSRFYDIDTKVQNIDSTLTDNTRTYFTNIVDSTAFRKLGGTNLEYLMADGSTTIASGSGGNSSNIYLYNSNTTLLPPTGNGQIRFNNAIQDDATEIYVSHLTRDAIDIDEFLLLINTLSIIYIQDQNTSLNFIKYTVSGIPTIVINDYITIPVLKQSSSGTGSTNFSNGHNIFMSVFSNETLIDNRITTVESKTQNQNAIPNETTFAGYVIATNYLVPDALPNEILYSDGSHNSSLYDQLNSTSVAVGSGAGFSTETVSIGHNAGLGNQGDNGTAVGHNAGGINQGMFAVALGAFSAFSDQGIYAISIGNEAGYTSQGNYSIAIGNVAGSNNQSTKSIVINSDSGWSGNTEYQTTQGLFISPVRINNSSSNNIVCFNTASKELTYNNELFTNVINSSVNTSIEGAIPIYDGVTGKLLKSSGASCDISNNVTANGFKTSTGTSTQVLCADGTIDNNLFKMVRKNWDFVPLTISNGSMTANSWDYYMNDQVPYDMYISKIRVNFSTGGSDTSRFAIYRGNDLSAVLVAQTALLASTSIIQPYTTIDFITVTGQNTYFQKDESIVIAYASGGTSTRISTVLVGTGNTNLGWYNTTESVAGFPTNPRSKAGASVAAFCCRLIVENITPTNITPALPPTLVTPHNLTSSISDPEFLVTASNIPSATKEWNLFNGDLTSGHPDIGALYNLTTGQSSAAAFAGYQGDWIKIALTQIKTFNRYRLALNAPGTNISKPYDWVLLGSIDNVTWSLIDTQTAYPAANWVVGGYAPTIIVPTSSYRYIAYVCTRNANSISAVKYAYYSLVEMDFFNL
jgi:hypothetical protein